MSAEDESNEPEASAEGTPPAEPEDRIAAWVGRARVPVNWASTLTRWLEKQRVSDQYARLEQAGHNLEEASARARLRRPGGVSRSAGGAERPR